MKRLIIIVCMIFVAGCYQPPPVPDHIEYRMPPDDIGRIGDFMGEWHGTWGGVQKHALYVLEVSPESATVILSWSRLQFEMIRIRMKSGYKEIQGKFIGQNLFVENTEDNVQGQVTYKLNSDNTITAYGKMSRIDDGQTYEMISIMRRAQKSK